MVTTNINTTQTEKSFATVEDYMAALDRVMKGEVDMVTDPDGDITFRLINKGLVMVKIGDRFLMLTKKKVRKNVRNQ
jgi:hypothetical protein